MGAYTSLYGILFALTMNHPKLLKTVSVNYFGRNSELYLVLVGFYLQMIDVVGLRYWCHIYNHITKLGLIFKT